MRESVDERHKRVLRLVRERESVRVVDLAVELGISVETARRDVAALADVGRVRRLHGSVVWPTAELSARDVRLARQAPPAPPSGLTLGMVVPAADYFYPSVIRGARAAAAAAGVRLRVGITDYRRERDPAQIKTLIEAGVDGLLLTPNWSIDGPSEADLQELGELRVPVVLMERQIPMGASGAGLDRVSSDHAEGAAAGVRHLAGIGHGRIALMSRTTHSRPRIRRGYRAAMSSLGLPDDDLSALNSAPTGYYDTFESDTDRLLDLIESDGVRAAIVHTDTDAINLLQRLLIRGYRVPEDFAIVCYDDELAELADVPLTSIAPAKRAIGESAAKLLLRRLENPAVQSTHIELLPQLHVRESCGAPSK
ncbi:substrate-binding domain-containing protein [Streptomyces sp. NPDC020681]|uniref:substrate-binding domain-containing protein n=1 Tax=Streptomyces sp. NPDC020681 TaxID=3365083 RepID=UPI0037B08D78